MRFIIALYISLISMSFAHDLGVYGHLFPVIEINPVTVIQSKLQDYEKSGELETMKRKFQQQVEASILRPKPVTGLTTTETSHRIIFTPSFTLNSDIYDYAGNLLFAKGLTVNPWDIKTYPKNLQQFNITVPRLSKTLLILNGDDPRQCAWAKAEIARLDSLDHKYRIILINGNTRDTAETLQRQVYFDQNSQISRYFTLKHIPALITREDNHCVIQIVAMTSKGGLKKETTVRALHEKL